MLTGSKCDILFTKGEKKYVKYEINKYKIDVLFKFLYTRLINLTILLSVMLAIDLFHMFYIHSGHLLQHYSIILIILNYILICICMFIKIKNIRSNNTLNIIRLTSWLPYAIFAIQLYYIYLPYAYILL